MLCVKHGLGADTDFGGALNDHATGGRTDRLRQADDFSGNELLVQIWIALVMTQWTAIRHAGIVSGKRIEALTRDGSFAPNSPG